ncbi:MAG: hypothetical protein AAGI23_14020 [Bacteroidota bacterium]
MRTFTLLTLCWLSFCTVLVAQVEDPTDDKNWKWKKHVKMADELYNNSQYADAAYHYKQAFEKKPKKTQYAYKAGRAFLIIKDYESALANFDKVKDNYKKFPRAQYYHAKALKHSERYVEAKTAFKDFAERYTGEMATELISDALAEVKACEVAKAFKDESNNKVRVVHLDAAVNTKFTDFSPMPFGSDELLFSSTVQNNAKIFESKRGLREWDAPTIPAQFATLEGEHVCNPAFSPDEKKLYFTVCRSIENWGALTTICEIYMTKRIGNLWSAPQRLPDKINVAEVTATQPFVVHQDGKEILYFASNRAGGQGGMDIWYSTRKLDGDDLAFSAPRNLGAKINTEDNEITPYYSLTDQMLYFSSDGHQSMGGLDIFSASGSLGEWERPANLGTPYNSGADDYFYIQNRYGDGGFFVSNRIFEPRKNSTTDEDIFEFRLNAQQQSYVIKGIVYDKIKNTPLADVDVSVFEILGDDSERMIKSATFSSGSYLFQVPANKNYKIVADKVGFAPDTRTFTTGPSGTQTEYLYLTDSQSLAEGNVPTPSIDIPPMEETVAEATIETPTTDIPTPTNTLDPGYNKTEARVTTVSNSEAIEYEYTPNNPIEAFRLRTKAPRHTGVYFKIQLIALSNFSFEDPRFDTVENMERLDYEVIIDRRITRALLGDYFTRAEVEAALAEVQTRGFDDAFIVKYEDGERVKRIRL